MPSIQSLTMTCDALNEEGTFSEGDTLTGRVTLALLKDTTIESFFVKAKGDANVRWTKKVGDRTRTYSAHRRYFKLKQFFTAEHSKETILPRGTHVFDFTLRIPDTSMPSTFRGRHGRICYVLETKLSRSWKIDRIVDQDIKFVTKSFPNIQSFLSPQIGLTDKEMGFFSKGSVHMEATIERRAFAPGESAVVTAKINNSSSSEMKPKMTLLKTVVYRATSSTNHENHILDKVVEACMRPKSQREIRCVLKIPHDEPLSIQNCDIISVEYQVKVYLDISLAFDPEILFPIIIVHPALVSGATGLQSRSDFPQSAAPASFNQGPVPPAAYGAGQYSAAPQPYSQPRGAYSYPPPQASAYGSPFSSPSSSVVHPPPSAPTFPAPAPEPYPSAPPAYTLPSAPTMNTDFLSQSDEPPPAYSLLFPSSVPDTNK
ncbi:arrestin domain-containing protein 3-like [Synchiropus splendidus]|uniref:arrestin domain-containing protein 3-like n=1 Tax=Synchiropus splendidus TaxID=270530 RepID=UPI00237DEF83|nr:arrestin domain-containing protein 3-like [Synchiropus splendidus]